MAKNNNPDNGYDALFLPITKAFTIQAPPNNFIKIQNQEIYDEADRAYGFVLSSSLVNGATHGTFSLAIGANTYFPTGTHAYNFQRPTANAYPTFFHPFDNKLVTEESQEVWKFRELLRLRGVEEGCDFSPAQLALMAELSAHFKTMEQVLSRYIPLKRSQYSFEYLDDGIVGAEYTLYLTFFVRNFTVK